MSVSLCLQLHPNSVHITAVLVEYKTNTGRVIKGVATSWLKNMIPSDDHTYRVPIYIRHSSLRLPYRPSNPVIMVGPGTGLAPFRGFIQERSAVNTNGRCSTDHCNSCFTTAPIKRQQARRDCAQLTIVLKRILSPGRNSCGRSCANILI